MGQVGRLSMEKLGGPVSFPSVNNCVNLPYMARGVVAVAMAGEGEFFGGASSSSARTVPAT